MTLHVQKFLRDGGTLTELQMQLGIVSKPHPSFPWLFLLKYDMIDSPMDNFVVQECRGIILNAKDDWNTVSRALDKFFNSSEHLAASIDWNTARVQTKEDGSLMTLSFYEGQWNVSTSGTPDAGGDINGSGMTFAALFWQAFGDRSVLDTDEAKGHCFWFELTSPYNRIVVDHKQTRLTLLGARRKDTWEEIHPSLVAHLFPTIPVVKEFPLRSMDDVSKALENMNPLEQEGFVICDAQFRRVKAKSLAYVALHHAKDGLTASIKNFVEIVRKGETSEWLTAFPELETKMTEVRSRYDILVSELNEAYQAHASIEVQKDFALAIKSCKCPAALFALRAKKVSSIGQWLAQCPIDTAMVLLGYKEK
jgi:hypothetical protein